MFDSTPADQPGHGSRDSSDDDVARASAAHEPARALDPRGAEPLPEDTPSPGWVRYADDEPWTDVLARTSGPALLPELLEVSPGALGDLDLVASLDAWERLASWVAARHAEALGALLARAPRFGGIDPTAALLAAETVTTQRAAKDKLVWAHTLGMFPLVAEALELGVVDVPRARAICEEAMTAPEEAVQRVADLGLALAPHKTPPQLRRALRAAVIGLDPAAAEERAKQARAERRVEFRPLPDAMAEISAILPATDAMAVKTALDALARTTGTDDPRTFDQRRADYLASIFHAILDAGEAPLRPEHLNPSEGTGAVKHEEAAWQGGSDGSCKSGEPDGSHGQGTAPESSAPHPLWRRLATTQRYRAHLHVTVGAGTLLGLDDHPGELAGYGPIPADTARMVAGDATWRALLTDPAAGTVTAVGEKSYRPGAVLTREVAARDRTCTFFGCSRPAHQCDIDHRVPFTSRRPAAEQTCAHNLQALCRFHHNLKTRHGWGTSFDPESGVTTWHSPLGTRHDRAPEPPLPPWEEWLRTTATPRAPLVPCPCTTGPARSPESGPRSGSPDQGSHDQGSGPRAGPDPPPF